MAFPKMIEPKQIQLIHIAQTQLCLSDDNYRGIIGAQTKGKKHSSKDLTYFEADAVINYFVKTLGFIVTPAKSKHHAARSAGGTTPETKWRGKYPPNVFVLPSRDQFDMIDALRGKITWKLEDGFQRWLKKYIKTDRVKTADQASRTIEGLKKMLEHQTQNCHYSPGENIA